MTQIPRFKLRLFNQHYSSHISICAPSFCLPALQAAEAPLAKLPELPSAQFGLGPAPDQLSVCATDESAPKALAAAAHCFAGETHPYKQTWLQLVSALVVGNTKAILYGDCSTLTHTVIFVKLVFLVKGLLGLNNCSL